MCQSLFRSLLLFPLMLLAACGSTETSRVYQIGVDPTWYPLELQGKENQVSAFSTEILEEIGKLEKIPFVKIKTNPDTLLFGLKRNQYDAILTSMQPYIFNEKQYDFSDLYLMTGPVLVVPENSPVHSLNELAGKEVAASPDSPGMAILEKAPGVVARSYTSIPQAFNDISAGQLDGAIVGVLLARSYCQDLYHGVLKIATDPLDNSGLRLMTLHGEQDDLIEAFNRGLQQLKENGKYDEILRKWKLGNSS